jgi:hypothetical protein
MCTEQRMNPLHCFMHASVLAQQLLLQLRCVAAKALAQDVSMPCAERL